MKFLFVFALFVTSSIYSQSSEDSVKVEPKIPRVAYGFNLGKNYLTVYSSDKVLPNNGMVENGDGLKMGVFIEYRVSDHFFISPKSEISFSDSRIKFPVKENRNYAILPFTLDLSLHSVIKLGNDNWRPYLVLGASHKMSLGSTSGGNDSYIKNNNNTCLDIGVGLEKWFTSFKVAPEIRYSYGVVDVNRNPLLKDLYVNSLSLILNVKS